MGAGVAMGLVDVIILCLWHRRQMRAGAQSAGLRSR
jgi:hypothetical protein